MLVGNVDNERGYICVGQAVYRKALYIPVQFYSEFETAKQKSVLKKKKVNIKQ